MYAPPESPVFHDSEETPWLNDGGLSSNLVSDTSIIDVRKIDSSIDWFEFLLQPKRLDQHVGNCYYGIFIIIISWKIFAMMQI